MHVAVCIQSAHNEVYQQKMRWFAEGVSTECDVVQWTSLPKDHNKYVPVIYGSVKKNRSAAHHRIKSQV